VLTGRIHEGRRIIVTAHLSVGVWADSGHDQRIAAHLWIRRVCWKLALCAGSQAGRSRRTPMRSQRIRRACSCNDLRPTRVSAGNLERE
jgi:hypothetical protein